jgi:predicted Ser/Thr protein kinase
MSSSPPLQHPALPQLAAFAMGRLAAAEQGTVRDHLAQCPSRRKTLAALNATNARTLPPPLPQACGPTTTGAPAPSASQTSAGRSVPAPAGADTAPPPEFANHPRYQIVKLLGEGGMGAVYLANDKQLGRKVALKIPRVGAGSEIILARFQREARAPATLDHPNICPVYDVGTVVGVPYLTMAYIEGRPLAELLAPRKQLPERQVAGMVRKLALILQEAHKRGIIHRDLKPGNVMINSRKEPIIMDFGLARRACLTRKAAA